MQRSTARVLAEKTSMHRTRPAFQVSSVKCESVMDFANFETRLTLICLQETAQGPVDVTDFQLTAD